MSQDLASKVWLMHGVFGGAAPGMLGFKDGTVSFETPQGEVFNVPLTGLKEVKWPTLQFGLGFNAVVNGEKYKFTFMKPNGAADLDGSFIGFTRIGRGIESMATLAKWGDSKAQAKLWKELLK